MPPPLPSRPPLYRIEHTKPQTLAMSHHISLLFSKQPTCLHTTFALTSQQNYTHTPRGTPLQRHQPANKPHIQHRGLSRKFQTKFVTHSSCRWVCHGRNTPSCWAQGSEEPDTHTDKARGGSSSSRRNNRACEGIISCCMLLGSAKLRCWGRGEPSPICPTWRGGGGGLEKGAFCSQTQVPPLGLKDVVV